MKEIPINSLMRSDVGLLPRTTPVHTVQSDQSLFDALVISQTECVRHLPVFDNQDIFLGIVTQTDTTTAHFRVIEMQRTLIERTIENPTEELPVANRELQSLSMEDALLAIENRRAILQASAYKHSMLGKIYWIPYAIANMLQ